MRDIVIKKIKLDSYSNNGSYYAVRVDHFSHRMEFESLGGASANWEAFKNFCMSDKDMVKELKWALTEYTRENPVFIKERTGVSGCYDVTLFSSKGKHVWAQDFNIQKVLSLHISCAGKLNDGIPDMFSGDLLEILYYMDEDVIHILGKERRKKYTYPFFKRNPQIKRVQSVCGCGL